MPEQEQKVLISEWISAWAVNDKPTQERANQGLNATGLWAYEAGSGLPIISHWYNGQIKPGMRFIWNPGGTEQKCRVTRVTTGGDEPLVWCVDVAGGPEFYNEESHFRAMVAPVGEGGQSRA